MEGDVLSALKPQALSHPSRIPDSRFRIPLDRFAAFSLVEMLVVIAVIAILTALSIPAFKGLVGVSGIRGGTDTILGALSVAQSAALESGGNAYLAFPNDTFTRFIVLSQNATNTTLNLATPRWAKLPTGIQINFLNTNGFFTNLSSSSTPSLPALPRIDGSNAPTSLRAIQYDRFGSLKNAQPNLQLLVGEGFSDGTNVTFTGPTNTRAVFTAQRLTGKWNPSTNN